jgi:hypothetical protein
VIACQPVWQAFELYVKEIYKNDTHNNNNREGEEKQKKKKQKKKSRTFVRNARQGQKSMNEHE